MDRYTQKRQVKGVEHRRLLVELKGLAASVGRCHHTITALMVELNSINAKFQGQRSTVQEVEYLTGLLACAKKKLSWEKQIVSLQKRAPAILADMTKALNDAEFPPAEELKAEMLATLLAVQKSMDALQAVSGITA